VVVAPESRRGDANPDAVIALLRHAPVAPVVVQPGVPEERLLVRADLGAVRPD
jgi:hypothetical protein